MSIFQTLTDNQLALLGCAAALLTSGTLMAVSHYLGRFVSQIREPAQKPCSEGTSDSSRKAA